MRRFFTFLLLLSGFFSFSYSQYPAPNVLGKAPAQGQDSLYLLQTFASLNSTSEEINGGFYDARILKSPDGKLKIFQFLGEGCGNYCNPMVETHLQWAGKIYDLRLDEITKIFPLESESGPIWLLETTTTGKPRGVESVSCSGIAALKIEDGSPAWAGIFDGDWRIQACTSSFLENAPQEFIRFNPGSKVLEYGMSTYEEASFFKTQKYVVEKGTWKWTGSRFYLETQIMEGARVIK